jgi:hypothetical protein
MALNIGMLQHNPINKSYKDTPNIVAYFPDLVQVHLSLQYVGI